MSGRGWAYVGALLGGAVSIAANVAHSYVPPAGAPAAWRPQGGAVLGAVFWPVALFVAIEILARVAWPAGRRWVAVRYLGLLPVAAVAAVVSYRHLSGLLTFYGEDGLTVAVGPLAVDGLMVMATGALIATGHGRTAPSAVSDVYEMSASAAKAEPAAEAPPAEDVPPVSPVPPAAEAEQPPQPPLEPPADPPVRARTRRSRRPAGQTRQLAADVMAAEPHLSRAELAARVGLSERRLREVLASA